MPDQLLIGNFSRGQRTDRLAFNIDNDTFPTMFNFYTWRGRVKRKRGTKALAQLQKKVQIVSASPLPWQIGHTTLNSQSWINLLGVLGLSSNRIIITNITQASQAVVTVSPEGGTFLYAAGQTVEVIAVSGMKQIIGCWMVVSANAGLGTITLNVDSTNFTAFGGVGIIATTGGPSLVPGSINLTVGANTYTENLPLNGVLNGNPSGTGVINYNTGTIFIKLPVGNVVTGTFSYYPALPVMGLEDFSSSITSSYYPILLAFDTDFSYQIKQSGTPTFYNTSFYKNTNNPIQWTGTDFQQFWSTNYPATTSNFSGSFWATNNKAGFHFVTGTYSSGTGTTQITFTFLSNSVPFTTLINGDFLWFNEWNTGGSTINNITGVVSDATGAAGGVYKVTFATAQSVAGTGIAQLLTNSIPGQDGIRWYDGDPTGATGLPTGTNLGWVNFAPPLTALTVSINDTQAATYYLVGALAIVPFKDRLLFFSPYIGTSAGITIQLQDTVIWSWNGTPYYTVDSNGAPSLVPTGQTANVKAYYVDQTGLGGYISAGIAQPITTISNNQDVLLVGFGGDGRKTRFVYTGSDLDPFLFFNINSELPSFATYSAVVLDRGVIDIGQYGIALTDQQSSQRIDLDIPDSVFQIKNQNNGPLRVNAIRDFYREWIYFSYPVNNIAYDFPTQTFLFNYRDNTWAVLYENFTRHGNFRPSQSRTWATTGFSSWDSWREPWNAGINSTLVTQIIAGTPQGFVLVKGDGTGEAPSGYIQALVNNNGKTQITSNNHCVLGQTSVITNQGPNPNTQTGDYVLILNCIGNSLDSTRINGKIGIVTEVIDENNFVTDINFPFDPSVGFYIGLGTFTRLSQPLLQTKQFPLYWQEGRKMRMSVQKYLLDRTNNGQITVNFNLSQDAIDAWNDTLINPPPNSLLYSQTVFTSPEYSIQNCFNLSLGNIGNNVILSFTFNYPTLFDFSGTIQQGSVSVTVGNVATFQDNGNGGFTATGTGNSVGSSINYITGDITIAFTVAPMSSSTKTSFAYLTPNIQMPIADSQNQIWHRYNTSLIGDSVQLGFTLNDSQMKNIELAQDEITLHAIQLTVDRGPLLA